MTGIVREDLRRRVLAPEPRLELEERQHHAVLPGEQLAVEDPRPGQVAGARDDLRELAADVVQVARVEADLARRAGGAGRGSRRTCPRPRRSGPSRARISAASSAGEASMNLSGWNSVSAALAEPVLAGRGPRSGRCRR